MKTNKLLTVEEIAHVLNVSGDTIYYWLSRGELPYIQIGKHKRFSLEVTLKFFADKQFRDTGIKVPVDLYIESLETPGSLTIKEKQEDEKAEAKISLASKKAS